MKTASITTEIKNGENTSFRFNFSFCPAEDSASIKAWEDENLEYSSWNLILDQQDLLTC
jgi:hypothetical protein